MSVDLRIMTCRPYHELTMAVSGELDLATAPTLSGALDAVHADLFDRATLDCAALEFCDCAGLNTLIDAHHAITAAGGHLHLTHPGRTLRRLIHTTNCGWLLGPQIPAPSQPVDAYRGRTSSGAAGGPDRSRSS